MTATAKARAGVVTAAQVRLGIVTPWFGPTLQGGAEQQSFQLANNFAARGYLVDVLTTCNASFADDWSRNTLRPGAEKRGNLTVYRFKTRKRDRRAFDRVNAILTELPRERLAPSVSPIGDDDAHIFYEENINAPGLLSHLSQYGSGYHGIIFIPYLYGTTLGGLPLVRERAFLQPCLHDESYAYLQRVQENVQAARGLLLNSAGELELAVRLYGPGIIKKSAIVGEGVLTDVAPELHAHHVNGFAPREHAYVLYLGRQDETKNVGMLLQVWNEFKRRRPMSPLQLVLAGRHSGSNSDKLRAIVDLGSVTAAEKNALLANCVALAQPSLNESFSRVLYETWTLGRPVVVHGDCLATATAVRSCDGGLIAATVPEWQAALEWIDEATAAQLSQLGERGRSFARDYASWDAVIERYERVLGLASRATSRPERQRGAVRQIVPDNERAQRYAAALTRALERDRFTATPEASSPDACGEGVVILHHACGEMLPGRDVPDRATRVLVVHATNRDDPRALKMCSEELRSFVPIYGTSGFASTQPALDSMRAAGFTNARLAPISVDPREWDILPDRTLAEALHDGKQNLLYVGALVTRGHLDQLIITFLHYLTFEREARLTIVGTGRVDDALYRHLLAEVHRLDLADHVLVARNVSEAQFVAVFRAADVLISLDPADDLGEAFLQAMWFDVPILAYRTRTAQALLGEAGLLLTDTSDLLAIAALAQLLVLDPSLRSNVLQAERRARAKFDSETLVAEITSCHGVRA